MLEAGREGLYPRETIRLRQHARRNLADERIRAGHGRLGLDWIGALTHSAPGAADCNALSRSGSTAG